MLSIAPEPSTSRGEVTLQPSYFTSSLYVDSLREDVTKLISLFSDQYQSTPQPFELFKKLWSDQGWSWLHLRVYDGRARQSFLHITERLLVERLADKENTLTRVVALFSLYTFYNTQPSTSAPPFYSTTDIAIPIDIYEAMVALPSVLDDRLLVRLRPYVVHILTKLLDAQIFRILPPSSLRAHNPSNLPREVFVPEEQDTSAVAQASHIGKTLQKTGVNAPPKKKGRPSKRDKLRKARDALLSLDKYVDRNTIMLLDQSHNPAIGSEVATQVETGHVVFGQAPHGSLDNYLARKNELLAAVQAAPPNTSDTTNATDADADTHAQLALKRANEAVLARLKQIDAMAAEQGLEVGGEGGEKTGLSRVERVVEELRRTGMGASAGILGLLEGAGRDGSNSL